MFFLVGVHHPHNAKHVDFAFISVATLRRRKGGFVEPKAGWVADSAGFSTVANLGEYPEPPEAYAIEMARWVSEKLLAVVSEDYMCEPMVLKKTGLTVLQHQQKTIERYDRILAMWNFLSEGKAWPPIMPVLQGWTVEDYVRHLEMYGDRIKPGMWVGVGSVCKRQKSPKIVEAIFRAIKDKRPDIRIHAFGLKIIALMSKAVRDLIYSSDSLAWSFAARYEGRDANDINEALDYVKRVEEIIYA